ncbi:hypothetical protein OBBRIDRAFT_888518 [Obba rivulosa]|uniref:Uncharacterized protein n=1 Tax=Obba rivulosa TaxID=1052685 RepID=A0A8E2DIF4_9APHY|nr:hypothetical protein OBBRIDRAFT_888518 [Obba rivulosa]
MPVRAWLPVKCDLLEAIYAMPEVAALITTRPRGYIHLVVAILQERYLLAFGHLRPAETDEQFLTRQSLYTSAAGHRNLRPLPAESHTEWLLRRLQAEERIYRWVRYQFQSVARRGVQEKEGV